MYYFILMISFPGKIFWQVYCSLASILLIVYGCIVYSYDKTDKNTNKSDFYILKTGCSRRFLLHNFPKWQTVYEYFSTGERDGTWKSRRSDDAQEIKFLPKRWTVKRTFGWFENYPPPQ